MREKYIRDNAYYKWQDAGCPDGRDLEFWNAASVDWDSLVRPIAYQAWEGLGKPDGCDKTFWFIAECVLTISFEKDEALDDLAAIGQDIQSEYYRPLNEDWDDRPILEPMFSVDEETKAENTGIISRICKSIRSWFSARE